MKNKNAKNIRAAYLSTAAFSIPVLLGIAMIFSCALRDEYLFATCFLGLFPATALVGLVTSYESSLKWEV